MAKTRTGWVACCVDDLFFSASLFAPALAFSHFLSATIQPYLEQQMRVPLQFSIFIHFRSFNFIISRVTIAHWDFICTFLMGLILSKMNFSDFHTTTNTFSDQIESFFWAIHFHFQIHFVLANLDKLAYLQIAHSELKLSSTSLPSNSIRLYFGAAQWASSFQFHFY